MKIKYLDEKIKYDGSQLSPLYNYLKHDLLGDSIISFCGPCDISLKSMIDGEDLKAKNKIYSEDMLHFLVEIFSSQDLKFAVSLQRLLCEISKKLLSDLDPSLLKLIRKKDDLFLKEKKLNVSIATKSTNSLLIHFGINVSSQNTPVQTLSLNDFKIDPKEFSKNLMDLFKKEYLSILEASVKVKTF